MIGETLSHYRIISKIGSGGMGEVYLAQDAKLDRNVAIKLLADEFNKDPDRLNRFIQEARAASALNHPNILTIYEVGETDGKHYIATEFIEGETLRHCIQHRTLKTRDALDAIVQVASALAAAHQAGIIHRDIKPENVMLRPDGFAKVLDFGLAKLTETRPGDSVTGGRDEEDETLIAPSPRPRVGASKTNPGTIMGTVQYMSPEQARGKPVDARTDIFSLGVVLYEVIAGRVPFAGESSTDVLAAILEKEPAPLARFAPDVPAELQRIVNKSLRKTPDERYQTMRDLLLDLKELRDELALEAKLERSIRRTDVSAENQRTVTADGEITKDAVLRTSGASIVQTTSSAEYLVSQIQQHKRGVLVGSLVLFLAVIGSGYWLFWNRAATNKPIDSIAVMPFVNESGNQDVEYLSDGMTETLISSLSQLANLNVRPRSSVFRYKGKETNPQTIGKELNVQAILNGRVVQRGQDLSLFIELIDVALYKVVWSQQYNRKQTDLVTLQSEIARDVSSKLRTKLSGADEAKLAKKYTENPEAYRLYLQGRFYWNKRAGKLFERAPEYFQQAVDKDPNFALGYVGLADVYSDTDRAKAKECVTRALSLDDESAEAHATLGYQYLLDYEFAAAERELKRAMKLNPNYAPAYQWNGSRLMMLGKYDDAFVFYRRALEIEPTSTAIDFNYAACLVASGELDEGIEHLKKIAEMDPTFVWTHSQLSFAYRLKGDHAASVEERAKSLELNDKPGDAKLVRESFANGGWTGYLREAVRQASGSNQYSVTGKWRLASLLALLGEKERAMAELERASKEGDFWLFAIRWDPAFDPLRTDPRFQEILKKFNSPQ